MNFQQLRTVREAVRHDFNLTATAAALFTSQPGVSRQIRELEQEIGVEIFQRYGKRLLGLTAPGETVLEIIERLLHEADNLKRAAEEHSNQRGGHLIVATTHTQARYVLPKVVGEFKRTFPDVKLALQQSRPEQIAEQLLGGRADIGIATESLLEYPELVVMPGYEWSHVVVVPDGHALLSAPALTLEALCAWPLITYDPGFTGRPHIDAAFARAKLRPEMALTALDSDVIKTYVELGLGVGIVASMAFDARRDAGLRTIEAGHLFEANLTRVALRRGTYLRGFMLTFLERFASHLTPAYVRQAMASDARPPRCGRTVLPGAFIAAAAALACAAAPTHAQPAGGYPSKPVRTIVAFAPGGANDVVVRLLGNKLSELWNQPVVVENRPGAGATLGMELVARSAPDGYTLGAGNQSSLVIGPLLNPKAGYHPLKDLTLIGSTALTAYVVAVNPSVPVKTVSDLVALARAKPGFLSYGTAGSGTISHIATEMLLGATGTRILHVPYKGAGPYLNALVSGEIDMALVALPAAEAFVRSGRLRLVAAAGARRAEAAPTLPTILESMIDIAPVEGRYGLVGPAGLPKEIVSRINASIGQALAAPDLRKRLVAGGFEPLADTPEQYAASVRLEIETFSRIIRQHGIKPDS